MSTRVVLGGRTVFASRDYRPFRPGTPALDREGRPVDPRPVAHGMPEPEGVPFVDGDGLTYRVVEKLNIAEGWGTAGFWMRRYRVDLPIFREWVERGWLMGAVERGSPTKRYRLRDERPVLEYLRLEPMTKRRDRDIKIKRQGY